MSATFASVGPYSILADLLARLTDTAATPETSLSAFSIMGAQCGQTMLPMRKLIDVVLSAPFAATPSPD